LGLRDWGEARPGDIESVWNFCEAYFQRNPYDSWFGRLNTLLGGLGVSYYDEFQPACHLDLVPYATANKWSALTKVERRGLGTIGTISLVQLLRASNLRLLILNGMSVVREFSNLLAIPLIAREIPSWTLANSRGGVKGYGYELRISRIHGKSLGREMMLLGYNHNIQSSFGVSKGVIAEITNWIAKRSEDIKL